MPLSPLDIELADELLPEPVARFLADVDERIDVFFGLHARARRLGFFPSDYPDVYRILRAVRRLDPDGRLLCEWGSGFGVVAALGAMLDYEACGIEIDVRLIDASRSLLEDYELDVRILHGTFIPDEFAWSERLSDPDTVTVISGASANDEVDVEIEDFDVIFAFPWPTEEELFCDLFRRYAQYGAVLVTYSGTEGVRAYRKVGVVSP